jgi:exonuclease SbcC
MRPRELTLRGFRSYADEQTFEWQGRGLVGIVGPIGSGKSSLLDAIAFALYGRTPRIESGQKSLINQRHDAMQVALTFEVGDTQWKAVRALRRTGAAAHALYRVEDGTDVVVADRAREMGDRIEALLGLDFDAFRRSVLLAQNQFADFLEATGTARNQVLKGVFGFDRLDSMRAVAKGRLDVLDRQLATLAGRRATAETDAKDLESKRIELTAVEQRAEALDELRLPFEEAKEVIKESETRLSDAQSRLERLAEVGDRIPDRERSERIFADAGEAAVALSFAEEELAQATAAGAELAAHSSEVLEAVGGRGGLEEVGDLVSSWKAERVGVAEAEVRLEATRAAKLEADAAASVAEQARAAAVVAEAEAQAADEQDRLHLAGMRTSLEAVHQEHRSHAIRSELVVGEACPVCNQPVSVIPDLEVPASLDSSAIAVEVAEEKARRAADVARRAAAVAAAAAADAKSADEAVVKASKQVAEAVENLETQRASLDLAATSVSNRLGPGDPEELLTVLREDVVRSDGAVAEANAAEQAARVKVQSLQDAASGAQATLAALRTELATLAGTLDVVVEIGEAPESLQGALVALRESWIGQQQAASDDKTKAGEEASAARIALRDLLEAAGLGESDDVVEVIAAAHTERTAKEAEVQLLEKRLGDLEQLVDDEVDLDASAEVLRTLHTDLSPSRFLEFVLDERRRALGDLASEHLEVLSAGRYRFDESGDFLIVDLTAADGIRAPASLSGGETFLASLALALALAEIVAREGGRLDAFFLDEGFGSLDPEHLDLAMDGIERLVTTGPDRLVVVVSHVPAVRDRVEDLIVLDRDAATGNTLVVSGSSPQ